MTGYGDTWRKYDAMEQRLSAPLTQRMLELAELEPGMNVLDVATGRGEPAIPAAHGVLPNGSVLGIDADDSVLQIARERAAAEGINNLSLLAADIEKLTDLPGAPFDVGFARWSLMYLQHPVRALRAVRKSLAAGSKLIIAVWADPDNASFAMLPRASLAKLTDVPKPDHDSPGTFYYADFDRLRDHLQRAGFEIQHTEGLLVDVMEAERDDELIDWARTFGMSRLLDVVGEEIEARWQQELLRAAATYRDSGGCVRLGGTSRIVVAT